MRFQNFTLKLCFFIKSRKKTSKTCSVFTLINLPLPAETKNFFYYEKT